MQVVVQLVSAAASAGMEVQVQVQEEEEVVGTERQLCQSAAPACWLSSRRPALCTAGSSRCCAHPQRAPFGRARTAAPVTRRRARAGSGLVRWTTKAIRLRRRDPQGAAAAAATVLVDSVPGLLAALAVEVAALAVEVAVAVWPAQALAVEVQPAAPALSAANLATFRATALVQGAPAEVVDSAAAAERAVVMVVEVEVVTAASSAGSKAITPATVPMRLLSVQAAVEEEVAAHWALATTAPLAPLPLRLAVAALVAALVAASVAAERVLVAAAAAVQPAALATSAASLGIFRATVELLPELAVAGAPAAASVAAQPPAAMALQAEAVLVEQAVAAVLAMAASSAGSKATTPATAPMRLQAVQAVQGVDTVAAGLPPTVAATLEAAAQFHQR